MVACDAKYAFSKLSIITLWRFQKLKIWMRHLDTLFCASSATWCCTSLISEQKTVNMSKCLSLGEATKAGRKRNTKPISHCMQVWQMLYVHKTFHMLPGQTQTHSIYHKVQNNMHSGLYKTLVQLLSSQCLQQFHCNIYAAIIWPFLNEAPLILTILSSSVNMAHLQGRTPIHVSLIDWLHLSLGSNPLVNVVLRCKQGCVQRTSLKCASCLTHRIIDNHKVVNLTLSL